MTTNVSRLAAAIRRCAGVTEQPRNRATVRTVRKSTTDILTAATASAAAVTLLLGGAALERRTHYEAELRNAHTAAAAEHVELNTCQKLLTQRGNEIMQCVDDQQEMANRLAQGIRCPRR